MSVELPIIARRPKPAPAAGPARSLRGDLKQFTREKIIAAALEAFAETGFQGSSVERIVELAGTTTPTFYRHFSSKADLLIPLQAFLAKEVSKIVQKLDSAQAPTVEIVRAWVWSYWQMWRRLRLLCAAYWEATMSDDDFAARIMPESLLIANSMSAFLAGVPDPRREKFRLRLAVMLTMLDRVVHHAGTERDRVRSRAMLDEFAEVLWLSLFSPARDIASAEQL